MFPKLALILHTHWGSSYNGCFGAATWLELLTALLLVTTGTDLCGKAVHHCTRLQ